MMRRRRLASASGFRSRPTATRLSARPLSLAMVSRSPSAFQPITESYGETRQVMAWRTLRPPSRSNASVRTASRNEASFERVERQLEDGDSLGHRSWFRRGRWCGRRAIPIRRRRGRRTNSPATRESRNPRATVRVASSPGAPARVRRRATARRPRPPSPGTPASPPAAPDRCVVATFMRSGWNSSTRTAARPSRNIGLPSRVEHVHRDLVQAERGGFRQREITGEKSVVGQTRFLRCHLAAARIGDGNRAAAGLPTPAANRGGG